MRHVLVLAHRYVGLAIAAFLVVASLTGSIAVFRHALDEFITPSLFRCTPPVPDAIPLAPLALRERVQAQLPTGVQVWELPLVPAEPGRTVHISLSWTGDGPAPMDEAYVDPYTGQVVGTRRYADLSQGLTNLSAFIFELHYALALGDIGAWILGVVAILWTIDCFVGLALTWPLPARRGVAGDPGRRGWFARWLPAWLVRTGSLFAAIFTVHRAAGLWLWFLLLLFAWSSVGLLMPSAYRPVMHALVGGHVGQELQPLPQPRPHPRMTWAEALERGRTLMAAEAARRGFRIIRPFILSHEPDFGFFRYQVQSDLDPSSTWCDTTVWMDSDTGTLAHFWAPTGKDAGDSCTIWLTYLHFGWVGGLAWRILICLVGVATAVLSVTGVWIWWSRGRRASA